MQRFEFSLDRVLKVKRQLERLAELEQQRARAAADATHAALEDYCDQLSRVAVQMTASVGHVLTPLQWTAAADKSERLGDAIRDSEATVAEAERKYQAAALARSELATEIEALDTLRSQQWERWKLAAGSAAQDRLDEVGMRIWLTARDGSAAKPGEP